MSLFNFEINNIEKRKIALFLLDASFDAYFKESNLPDSAEIYESVDLADKRDNYLDKFYDVLLSMDDRAYVKTLKMIINLYVDSYNKKDKIKERFLWHVIIDVHRFEEYLVSEYEVNDYFRRKRDDIIFDKMAIFYTGRFSNIPW